MLIVNKKPHQFAINVCLTLSDLKIQKMTNKKVFRVKFGGRNYDRFSPNCKGWQLYNILKKEFLKQCDSAGLNENDWDNAVVQVYSDRIELPF